MCYRDSFLDRLGNMCSRRITFGSFGGASAVLTSFLFLLWSPGSSLYQGVRDSVGLIWRGTGNLAPLPLQHPTVDYRLLVTYSDHPDPYCHGDKVLNI